MLSLSAYSARRIAAFVERSVLNRLYTHSLVDPYPIYTDNEAINLHGVTLCQVL
jgi:hypothetical protein